MAGVGGGRWQGGRSMVMTTVRLTIGVHLYKPLLSHGQEESGGAPEGRGNQLPTRPTGSSIGRHEGRRRVGAAGSACACASLHLAQS